MTAHRHLVVRAFSTLGLALGFALVAGPLGGTPQAAAQSAPAAAPSAPAELDGAESAAAAAEAPPPPATAPVLHLRLTGAIHRVAAEFLVDSLAEADAAGAGALVVELSTPGGFSDLTHEMVEAMLQAHTPVVVYVAPAGARAASAGFFLLMAADVAAMAPSTNTGAAASVGGGGEDLPETLGKKVEEDSAAFVRSLASRRGRNSDAAEAAVRDAVSYTAEEALEKGLIELLEPSLEELLEALDGREVTKGGRTVTLATAGAPVRRLELSAAQRALAVLADPNIAFLLLSLGSLLIYLEIVSPGGFIAGTLGVFALLLAFFGLSVLPTNVVGVALVALAVGLFVAELKVHSFGLLTALGLLALALGGLILFETETPEVPGEVFRVSRELIVGVMATAAVLVALLAFLVVRAFGGRVHTGVEGLLHERGVARSDLAPRGKVFVRGELWNAESARPVARGAEVEVVAVKGLTLEVVPRSPEPAMLPGEETS